MARKIRAKIPNGNTAKATLSATEDERIEIEVTTAEDDIVLVTTVDACSIRALHPLGDKAGDVGVWVPELRIHLWVGTVIIEDGTTHVGVWMNGMTVLEE